MSFTTLIHPDIFAAQRQFIAVMEAPRDFVWWAETLITEETKELKQAHEQNEGMEQIFKELADVIYVVCGFYNTMPMLPFEILPAEKVTELDAILEDTWQTVAMISDTYQIPVNLMGEAFAAVHVSNLSKLDDNGKPIRREDGKVLKGPNYAAPNMAPIVMKWEKLMEQIKSQDTESDATTH